MNLESIEKYLAGAAASYLVANKASLLADLAPLNVVVANDAVSFLDAEAAKVAGPLEVFVEGLINKYGAQAAPALATAEADGYDQLVAFLQHVAAA